MSRIFSDDDLLSWEVYSSGGAFGFPDRSKVVFLCLSDPDRRSRYVEHDGDTADAERDLDGLSDVALRDLLGRSVELD